MYVVHLCYHCHLRHDLLAAWADGLGELRGALARFCRRDMLHLVNHTQPRLLHLADQERSLLEQGLQLSRSASAINNSSGHPACVPGCSSAAQADPLAFFRAQASKPPRADAASMTASDLARESKQTTLEIAVHLHQLHSTPTLLAAAVQEEAFKRLQGLWSR